MSYSTKCRFNVTPDSKLTGSIGVNVIVDTEPFDASVIHCTGRISNLIQVTGDAAAKIVDAKVASTNNISNSLVKGFASLYLNEIRQRIVELAAKVPAKMQELKALVASCLEKHDQMTKDYERISERYAKLFNSLDQNLQAALLELDRPVFTITSAVNEVVFSENVFGPVVSEGMYAGGEQITDAAILQVASLKKNALNIISVTARNIGYNNELDSKISKIVTDDYDQVARKLYMPAVVMTTDDNSLYFNIPDQCPNDEFVRSGLADGVSVATIPPISSEELSSIDVFFRKKVSSFVEESDNKEYGARVADNVMRMWNSIRGKIDTAK